MEVDELFTDEKSENEGVWVEAGDYDPSLRGLKLRIARMMNPAFTKMLQEEVKNAGPKYDQDEKLQVSVMIKVMSKTILKGWQGLTSGGKNVKWTQSLGEEYLARSTDLRNVVTRISNDRARFKAERDKADLKN